MKTIKLIRNQKNKSGFTIMELMIATTVFAILLLLALAGFLQIGQLFYKGVNITRTSDAAKQAMSSIRNDVSFDVTNSSIMPNNSPLTTPLTDRWYFCAGANRYTYILGRQLDIEAESNEMKTFPVAGWNKFSLLKDKVVSGCPDPFNGVPINPANVTELLGDKMRLSNLTISLLPNSLYTLDVRIAYGIDEVLTSPATATDAKCLSGRNNSSYCFITDLRTTVRQGLQP